jgi:hypothetical protein
MAPGGWKHKGGGHDRGGKKKRKGKIGNNSSNNNRSINNNFLKFSRDSEEVSAKGGSREVSWVGAVAPFVSLATCPGISLQTVPRSKTLESAHVRCA